MVQSEKGISQQLAEFVSASRPEELPSEVIHEAKRALLNYLGCVLAGSKSQSTLDALAALPNCPSSPAGVIAHATQLDPLNAIFINAVAGCVLDFDDTHLATVIHPSCVLFPGLLAAAQVRLISGREFLHAFALGVEIECRIGKALTAGQHYRHGWHISATCGVFGAAIGVGKLIGLNAQQILWALGHAAAQSAGTIESFGSMAREIGIGNAARNGYTSAFFALAGMTGPPQPLEGTYGYARIAAEGTDFNLLLNGLGKTWELMQNAYKPYPAGVVLHPVIDACLQLHVKSLFSNHDIAQVEISGNPLLFERASRPHASTRTELALSFQHAAAVSLLFGRAGLAEFSDECASRPEVIELRQKISGIPRADIKVESAIVRTTLKDGRQFCEKVIQARGSIANPLSDLDLEKKFDDLVKEEAYWCDTQRIKEAVWAFDSVNNAAEIFRGIF